MNELLNFRKNLIQSDPIFSRIQNELNNFADLNKGDGILLAVSGGLDSMALFFIINEINLFDLKIAHVNHGLRSNSEKDEKFVANICDYFSLSFYSKQLDPSTMNKGESVEQWARIERYSFLKKTAKISHCRWTMTAHHGNDQAETILMNLSKKSGIAGLRGIAKQRNNIIRPLLGFRKKELSEFVKKAGIPFREDFTNMDISIPRNFIRHKVVKPWEAEFQNIIMGIHESANHFSDWKEGLDYLICKTLLPKVQQSDKRIEISLKDFKSLPKMVKIRLVQILTSENKNELWSKHRIKMLYSFLQKDKIGNQISLKNGWSLLRDRKSIIGEKEKINSRSRTVKLIPNQPVEFDKYKYEVYFGDPERSDSILNQEKMDWSVLKNLELEIRNLKEGDFFQPLGMKGHQKISDFLINEKVDRFSKNSQAVVTANGQIIWVCGKRIADWVKLTKDTKVTVNLSMSLL